jgi:hypothetical protein
MMKYHISFDKKTAICGYDSAVSNVKRPSSLVSPKHFVKMKPKKQCGRCKLYWKEQRPVVGIKMLEAQSLAGL